MKLINKLNKRAALNKKVINLQTFYRNRAGKILTFLRSVAKQRC